MEPFPLNIFLSLLLTRAAGVGPVVRVLCSVIDDHRVIEQRIEPHDPDNADEAASISKMNALQAGRAIAKIELKIAAAKSNAKPKPSNAPAPIEPVRGGGVAMEKDPAQMTDAEFAAWRRRQIAQRNK